jgi:dTMP kinase
MLGPDFRQSRSRDQLCDGGSSCRTPRRAGHGLALKRGLFITLEGIDGAGKSTQFRLLARHLRSRGLKVVATREPGGTRVGEQVRRILLASSTIALGPIAELALIYAARAQHLDEVVRPGLTRGAIVVSDRFNDASFAYQGFGRGLGVELVRAFDRIVSGKTQPDLTIVLDLDPRVALHRARGRETRRNSKRSRFELEGLRFQQRVRAGYLAIARRDPGRVRVVRANRSAAEVQAEIRKIVEKFFGTRGPGLESRKGR